MILREIEWIEKRLAQIKLEAAELEYCWKRAKDVLAEIGGA
jgi:hypothetical protein